MDIVDGLELGHVTTDDEGGEGEGDDVDDGGGVSLVPNGTGDEEASRGKIERQRGFSLDVSNVLYRSETWIFRPICPIFFRCPSFFYDDGEGKKSRKC